MVYSIILFVLSLMLTFSVCSGLLFVSMLYTTLTIVSIFTIHGVEEQTQTEEQKWKRAAWE